MTKTDSKSKSLLEIILNVKRKEKKQEEKKEESKKRKKVRVIDFNKDHIKGRSGISDGGSSAVTRPASIVKDTSDEKGQEYYIKLIKHGNQSTSNEITFGWLLALAGLGIPKPVYGINFHKKISSFQSQIISKKDHKYNKDKGIDDYYVASPIIDSFQDLGEFLINSARNFIIPKDDDEKDEQYENSKQYKRYEALRAEIEEIKARTKHKITAQDKIKKRDLSFKIFDLLPNDIKHDFFVLYYTALWVMDWDLLNFDLFNSGFIYHSENKSCRAGAVDGGNRGPIGYGGEYKDNSSEEANKPAKPRPKDFKDNKDPFYKNRLDYDPEFDPTDPWIDGIDRKDALFVHDNLWGITNIGSIPRRKPFAGLLGGKVRKETDLYEGHLTLEKERNVRDYLSNPAALEAAFRLSLIPDEAIDSVIDNWYMVGPNKEKIEFINTIINQDKKSPEEKEKDQQQNEENSRENVKKILKARRDHICSMFSGKKIQEWQDKNLQKAARARLEVLNEVAEILDIELNHEQKIKIMSVHSLQGRSLKDKSITVREI